MLGALVAAAVAVDVAEVERLVGEIGKPQRAQTARPVATKAATCPLMALCALP